MLAKVLLILLVPALLSAAGPQPGDVYREYRQVMRGNRDWRVTDPDSPEKGAREFLPNPVLEITIGDLQGAVRAEALIDRWGGHDGTTAKRIRFNHNAWIDLPELTTTPRGEPSIYWLSQDNPVVEIPLPHLHEGINSFEGTCGPQTGRKTFNWGQWGWTSIIVRIYYGPAKEHPRGRITSPRSGSAFSDNPTLKAEASSPHGIARVDFLAWYDGPDENGDGVYRDWHHAYFHNIRQPGRPGEPEISGHAASATAPPYTAEWVTRWVPDQKPKSMKLIARIRDRQGIWFVTAPVEGLTLARRGEHVAYYPASDVPARFAVRNKRGMSSMIQIPDSLRPEDALDAVLVLRTWNGIGEGFRFNGVELPIHGENHAYRISYEPMPREALKPGKAAVSFYSETVHHGVEVLWPGPGLLVRYRRSEI